VASGTSWHTGSGENQASHKINVSRLVIAPWILGGTGVARIKKGNAPPHPHTTRLGRLKSRGPSSCMCVAGWFLHLPTSYSRAAISYPISKCQMSDDHQKDARPVETGRLRCGESLHSNRRFLQLTHRHPVRSETTVVLTMSSRRRRMSWLPGYAVHDVQK
jgi:hypothetical protein